jgi:serine/threonine protein kinase
MTVAAGTKLGPYEITGAIGAGGMGEVYKAHDTKLGRDVAIKVLPEAFAHDPERLSRFQREAKMLAALNHPNIATIHGLEQSNGTRRWRSESNGRARFQSKKPSRFASRLRRLWKPLTKKASFTAT